MADDIRIMRDLVQEYVVLAGSPEMDERRDKWCRLHRLERGLPPIYIRTFAWREMPDNHLECEDPFWHPFELELRKSLCRAKFADDFIFEPWLSVPASYRVWGWGVEAERHNPDHEMGAYKEDYPLKNYADIEKLKLPKHEIDEAATAERLSRVQDAVGDLIEIVSDRGPLWRQWQGDLSTDLGHLRGIENFMLDMLDNPEWLHRLMKFMSEGVLKAQQEAEDAGDWNLINHENQGMSYADELLPPKTPTSGIKRDRLWCHVSAQEFTAVSPAMHEEFLLQYQMPIMAEFGLVAYGCCEDLTRKIDMLRQIPNLRRIAVSPFANVASCAEQIGGDYAISYRPSPADMVSYGFDERRVLDILRHDLSVMKGNGCCSDITLKDVETVEHDPRRIPRFVELARQVSEELFAD